MAIRTHEKGHNSRKFKDFELYILLQSLLSEKTDIHESKEKIQTHKASSKATRLFLTK